MVVALGINLALLVATIVGGGLQRSEVLGALANGVLLLIATSTSRASCATRRPLRSAR